MDLSGLLPLLDLPALAPLHAVRAGQRFIVGVPDGAKPALVALLAGRAAAPVLVVSGKDEHTLTLAEEIGAWLGDPARVVVFPEADAIPFERVAPDPEAAEERLTVLRALRAWRPGGHVPVIVAPAQALAQRTIAPDELGAASLEVQTGGRLSMRALLATLERLGYLIEPLVESPGQAARRGGIVDVFPPGASGPMRIELLGDRVESLRLFDPATQRTAAKLTEVQIGPAREAQADRAAVRELAGALDFTAMQHGLRPRFEEEIAALAAGEKTDPGFWSPFLLHATLLDHLPAESLVVLDEPSYIGQLLDELDEQAEATRAGLEADGLIPCGLPMPHVPRAALFAAFAERRTAGLERWATEETEGAILPPFGAAPSFGGRLRVVLNEVAAGLRARRRMVVVSQQAPRLSELFSSEGVPAGIATGVSEPPPAGAPALVQGSLEHGWTLDLPDGPLTVLTDSEVFGFSKQRRAERKPGRGGRDAFLSDLSPGDYVVHVEHGIAKFAGMVRRTVDGAEREYLELRYAEKDRLFVPGDQLDRVSRYVGPSDHKPQLTRLSSGDWARAKERVRRAVSDLAQELLKLYAAREVLEGHSYGPDTVWQQEMEAAFPYVETPDQLTALKEIKTDLERPRPMERVLIGDVGYGKTELAVRAAFKVVMDGKQVAVLAPTTVLAHQHYETFRQRVAGFPVRVDVLSRFRNERDQRAVVEDVRKGAVDILIGTHRILQKDIQFKDLGLAVIDEEQRFGVGHKERLKTLHTGVDVLNLSATPIPRTLHMALTGIRDMSTLETAPEERLPIRTYVSEFDERLIRDAIVRELDRGGQIYVVHNRVYNIELIAQKIREIAPEARVAVGHGQMPEETLERVMLDFGRGECDVLVCTTIIESGLDIPNVNTIIINQADKLGLSQLYQLRGRVGRGSHRAYAYLLYDRNHALSEIAQRRLQAIFDAGELGAGFAIAMKDLEIRGAGNLLGAEQSGHISAVGYELYSEMLGEAVKRMRALMHGETPPPPPPPPVTVDLPLTAHIPEPYVGDLNLRLAMYSRLAAATTVETIDEIATELGDRFGPPPPVVESLLFGARVRVLARGAGLTSVGTEDGALVLRAPVPIPHRERLREGLSDAVRPGTAMIRIERRAGWHDLLREVLERLQPGWTPPARTKRPAEDYGTFAPAEPRAPRHTPPALPRRGVDRTSPRGRGR